MAQGYREVIFLFVVPLTSAGEFVHVYSPGNLRKIDSVFLVFRLTQALYVEWYSMLF